jgi:tRNA-splicing ligase RtcB
MSKEKFRSSDFKQVGIEEIHLIREFGRTGKQMLRSGRYSKSGLLEIFRQLVDEPEKYLSAENEFRELAVQALEQKLKPKPEKKPGKYHGEIRSLKENPLYYKIFGREQIEHDAIVQMDTAMRLPVSVAGALMPDAHVGYGLPIGGVLATRDNVIIPYAVGVDIACRMCMSVFPVAESQFRKGKDRFKQALVDNTIFGVGGETKEHIDTGMFDKKDWTETGVIRDLKDLAYRQHGTSGGGNHFVEWGILNVTHHEELVGIPAGEYLALLTHSGSRGFGAQIAETYSKIAREKNILPDSARHLAWLDLDSEEGMEYWIAMNLAGEYASDNHHVIHRKISMALKLEPVKMIENHHNFAWKETLGDGTSVVVHRKGATPAGKENIGIIPGSMTQPGYVVRGKENHTSLNSASHGAGRLLSRNKALKTISRSDLKFLTEKAGVDLIGGDVDEAPPVYKNIEQVLSYQKSLVEVLAKFEPRIVRMAERERWQHRGNI